MPSANFTINSETGPYTAESGEEISLNVTDTRGLRSVSWEVFGAYPEAEIEITHSGSPSGSVGTFTLPETGGSGAAYGIRCRGTDTLGNTVTATAGIYVPDSNGRTLVGFPGETTEFGEGGWGSRFNALADAVGSSGTVLSFGAVGDGVTDDTEAIQKGIDSTQEYGGVLVLVPGVYRLTETLQISAPLTIEGPPDAVLLQDGENIHAIRMDNASNVTLRGFTVSGNSTGLGGAVTGNSGGHGIALDSASNVLIRGCRFENIGVTSPVHGNYASPICGTGVDAVSVEGCFFAESNRNRTGADIQLSGANISVQNGNRSVSYCDAFVNLGAEGTAIRHIVTGNFAYRAPDAISRSGVLYQYDAGSPAFADISHNQIEGFGWHGVYGTAEAAADGGGVIVAHNTIRYCGGLDDLAVPQNWPGSAVSPHGPAGAIVEGNYVYAMGYTSDGSPRDTPCSGILLVAGGEFEVANVTLRGNRIHGSSGPGIALLAQGTSSIRNIDIDGNIITDCLGVGIDVAAQATAVECITDVKIRGNQVRVGVDAVSGISIGGSNGGWANRIHIQSDNDVRYTGGGTSSAPGIARAGHSTLGRFTGSISGNYVSGFATGITVGGTIALYVPLAVPIDGNVIENCTTSIDPGATDFQVFDPSNVSRGHTNAYVNRGRPGRLLSFAGSARPLVELISSGLPTTGAWLAGDRVLLQTRRGPLIGYQCTVAGTPGVWTPIYEEIGFGTKIFVAPAFGTTALDSRGLESTAEVVGAATSRSWDTNRVYTRTPLVEYLDTSAGTDSIAGVRSDSAIFARSAFYTKLIWGPATGMTVGTRRAFAGLISSTSAPTDVDPSTLTNIIGMGWDDDDTQVQVMYNDDSGTATRVELGASFPRPVDDRTTLYALEVYVASSSALPIISVTNLVTGARATDVFASLDNCPAGDTPLCPYSVWASVGGTSGVAGVAFGGFEGWRVN